MLSIEKQLNDGVLDVQLEGRLDTNTSPELEEEMKDVLEQAKELNINCEKLDYISSSGLRVFLAFQKVMNKQGSMKVTNVNEDIMEIFEVTGFSDILTIE